MWIQQQTKVRALGAAMIVALMFVCSVAAFAAITSSSTSLQFPSQVVGTTSAPMAVQITNTNSGSITIGSVAMSATQFSYSGPAMPFTLAGGQSFTASVTFTPSTAQTYSGKMTFRQRTGLAALSVNLSGSGAAVVSSALTAAPAAPSLTIGENPAGAVAFAVSADQAWITASADGGTTSGATRVSANISGLAAGNYSGHVIVSAAGVTNAPMSIPVTLVVAAAQKSTFVLVMTPASLAFGGAVGSAPGCQNLMVNDTTPGPSPDMAITVGVDVP